MQKIRLSIVAFSLLVVSTVLAQPISLTQLNTAHVINFNSLASTGTTSSTPNVGCLFKETGTNANATYGIDLGTSNSGNTYSYGPSQNTDRALGTLASSSLTSTIGVYFVNNTNATISSVNIAFVMEQWRIGGRKPSGNPLVFTIDTSLFAYAINSGGVADKSGVTWNKISALNLLSKRLDSTSMALNGNDTVNQRNYNQNITVTLQPNDTIYFRWVDVRISGSNDGLAVDDLSLTPYSDAVDVSQLAINSVSQGLVKITWNKPASYTNNGYSTLVFLKKGSAINVGSTGKQSAANFTADTSATKGTAWINDTAAFCVYNGDTTFSFVSSLNIPATYYALALVVRDADSSVSNGVTASITLQNVIQPTAPLASISVADVFVTSSKFGVKWTKGSYTESTQTILVFAKKGAAINVGTPTANASNFVADSNWVNGSRFSNDTAARCIYKGDGNGVTLDGLLAASTYYVHAFVVRDADSVWSTDVSLSYTTKTAAALPITNFQATGTSYTAANLSWSLPTGYNTTANNVVVFAKLDNAINQTQTPTAALSKYTANTTIGLGTKLPTDTAATCIYNGDLTTVSLSALQFGKTYHFIAYVINASDSVYSLPTSLSYTQNIAKPQPINGLGFVGNNNTSAKIYWTKDASYDNTKLTTLVFVKANAAITDGTPTKSVAGYTANTVFLNGTKYQFDNNAYCVFKGDTNVVTVAGLNNTDTYYISVWVVEDVDSVYSAVTKTSGVTQIPLLRSNISEINRVNSSGTPDSAGKYVKLTGVVYGFNQRTSGLQFLLRDATGGITVNSATKTFGYNVTEGDSILVQGVVSTSRGLTQVTNIDTLLVYGSGKAIKVPTLVQTLNELSENDLIKMEGVRFVTVPQGGVWPSVATTIQVVKNGTTDTFGIRLNGANLLAGTSLPNTTLFNIVGIGGQISSSNTAPFAFDGYHVIPRVLTDIETIDSLSSFTLVSPAAASAVVVLDTIAGVVKFSWTQAKPYLGVNEPTYQVLIDTVGGDFTNPVLTKNAGLDTTATVTQKEIAQLLKAKNVKTGQSYFAAWKVVATTGNYSESSNQFTIQLTNGLQSGLYNATAISFGLYPNPVKDLLNISTTETDFEVAVYTITGQLAAEQIGKNQTAQLNVSYLPCGVYFVKVTTQQGIGMKKIVKD